MLAAQMFELGIAAPQVIAHRIARMAAAGTSLSAHDRAEFNRMCLEKLAAAHEAWAAMAAQGLLEYQKLGVGFMQSLWFPWMRPAPTVKSVSKELTRIALGILGSGIAPVHRRAMANARRLRRIK